MHDENRKYFVWDFDGTLAWRSGSWTSALLHVLKQNAPEISATPERVRTFLQSGFPWHAPENAHPGLSSQEWWDDLQPVFMRAFRGVGIQNGKALGMAREVREVYTDPKSWQLYKDTLPAMEMLSQRGWKHILLSNHVPELPHLLRYLGLDCYFLAMFNSAETGYEKPNPKSFRMVLDCIGADATAWMIGDNFGVDILGALETGMPGILVRKPHPDAPIYCPALTDIVNKI